jgi:hypothetical protein
MLALIAGTVSYLHMHHLVEQHGQPGWVAALTPLSVDGMIVAASTTLLAESRSGRRGGMLPWVLLVIGSVASLAANVAVAEPTMTGRVIAARPSFALIGSYELLMRQIRATTAVGPPARPIARPHAPAATPTQPVRPAATAPRGQVREKTSGRSVRQDALAWAMANRGEDGRLPSGKAIAGQFGRHERWGCLVKQHAASHVAVTRTRSSA